MRFFRRKKKRVLILGLDCAPPHLVFDQFRDDLPHLRHLMDGGSWGTLQSSVPCITVPAWSSMTSSRDPGTLGFYGFRNRADHSYNGLAIADGAAVKHRRIWDYTSTADMPNVIVGVPQTYPVRPLNGHLVSGFLTPGTGSAFTYPAVFKQQVLQRHSDYAFDVRGFRTDDKAWLAGRISDVTAQQFALVQHMLTSKPWQFAMFVNMGTDRVHHGFWRHHDPAHRHHDPNSPFRGVIRQYYQQVDQHIGDLLDALDDDVTVMVVSDHGVCRMDGGICLNEWLWREGWLALKQPPPTGAITRFEDAQIDWANTRAWGAGGYYGRVFLNVAGREPQGIIPPQAYQATRAELADALQGIPAPDGTSLTHTIYHPEAVYQQVNNIPPDLMVYFGGLHWRSVGSFGHDGIYTTENDTGPDDANHAPDGMFILHEPTQRGAGAVGPQQLMDVAPTVLDRLNIRVPADMQGRVMRW
jgi:predicted AlkP superfamily phosphohydrolase/phosphomutase